MQTVVCASSCCWFFALFVAQSHNIFTSLWRSVAVWNSRCLWRVPSTLQYLGALLFLFIVWLADGWQQAEYVAAKIMAIAHALTPYTDSNSFAAATATAAAAASKAPRVACSQPQMAAVAAARKLWHVK